MIRKKDLFLIFALINLLLFLNSIFDQKGLNSKIHTINRLINSNNSSNNQIINRRVRTLNFRGQLEDTFSELAIPAWATDDIVETALSMKEERGKNKVIKAVDKIAAIFKQRGWNDGFKYLKSLVQTYDRYNVSAISLYIQIIKFSILQVPEPEFDKSGNVIFEEKLFATAKELSIDTDIPLHLQEKRYNIKIGFFINRLPIKYSAGEDEKGKFIIFLNGLNKKTLTVRVRDGKVYANNEQLFLANKRTFNLTNSENRKVEEFFGIYKDDTGNITMIDEGVKEKLIAKIETGIIQLGKEFRILVPTDTQYMRIKGLPYSNTFEIVLPEYSINGNMVIITRKNNQLFINGINVYVDFSQEESIDLSDIYNISRGKLVGPKIKDVVKRKRTAGEKLRDWILAAKAQEALAQRAETTEAKKNHWVAALELWEQVAVGTDDVPGLFADDEKYMKASYQYRQKVVVFQALIDLLEGKKRILSIEEPGFTLPAIKDACKRVKRLMGEMVLRGVEIYEVDHRVSWLEKSKVPDERQHLTNPIEENERLLSNYVAKMKDEDIGFDVVTIRSLFNLHKNEDRIKMMLNIRQLLTEDGIVIITVPQGIEISREALEVFSAMGFDFWSPDEKSWIEETDRVNLIKSEDIDYVSNMEEIEVVVLKKRRNFVVNEEKLNAMKLVALKHNDFDFGRGESQTPQIILRTTRQYPLLDFNPILTSVEAPSIYEDSVLKSITDLSDKGYNMSDLYKVIERWGWSKAYKVFNRLYAYELTVGDDEPGVFEGIDKHLIIDAIITGIKMEQIIKNYAGEVSGAEKLAKEILYKYCTIWNSENQGTGNSISDSDINRIISEGKLLGFNTSQIEYIFLRHSEGSNPVDAINQVYEAVKNLSKEIEVPQSEILEFFVQGYKKGWNINVIEQKIRKIVESSSELSRSKKEIAYISAEAIKLGYFFEDIIKYHQNASIYPEFYWEIVSRLIQKSLQVEHINIDNKTLEALVESLKSSQIATDAQTAVKHITAIFKALKDDLTIDEIIEYIEMFGLDTTLKDLRIK